VLGEKKKKRGGKRKEKNKSTSHKQLTAKYVIAAKVCDEHSKSM